MRELFIFCPESYDSLARFFASTRNFEPKLGERCSSNTHCPCCDKLLAPLGVVVVIERTYMGPFRHTAVTGHVLPPFWSMYVRAIMPPSNPASVDWMLDISN